MQVDLGKLTFLSIIKVDKNRKYTNDTYKSIVFQVPLTEPDPLIAKSFLKLS